MTTKWIDVCQTHDLVDNSGVCALVEDKQIAVFKVLQDGQMHVYAIDNYDPFGKANVIYRGLLGSTDDKTVIISPLYKQKFCLNTGQCLDDDNQNLNVYPIRVVDSQVQLAISA